MYSIFVHGRSRMTIVAGGVYSFVACLRRLTLHASISRRLYVVVNGIPGTRYTAVGGGKGGGGVPVTF